ncbi:M23 family metallopeptidase [Patescibacteria group bacterium]
MTLFLDIKKLFQKAVYLFKPLKDGSLPISRFFRHVFEYKNIKTALGLFLAVNTIFLSFFSSPIIAFTNQDETAVLTAPSQEIHTETNFNIPILGEVSQNFHWYHPGIDIMQDLGQPIYPIDNGIVKEVEFTKWGYGHKVIIEHENGFQSLYAHLGEIKVTAGQQVTKDTIIATLGLTGWTTGPHLHLEIWQYEKPIDPISILPDFHTQDLLSNSSI